MKGLLFGQEKQGIAQLFPDKLPAETVATIQRGINGIILQRGYLTERAKKGSSCTILLEMAPDRKIPKNFLIEVVRKKEDYYFELNGKLINLLSINRIGELKKQSVVQHVIKTLSRAILSRLNKGDRCTPLEVNVKGKINQFKHHPSFLKKRRFRDFSDRARHRGRRGAQFSKGGSGATGYGGVSGSKKKTTLHFREITFRGDCDQKGFKQKIVWRQHMLRYCYERAFKRDSSLKREFHVQFNVNKGEIGQFEIKGTESKRYRFYRCFKRFFREIKFSREEQCEISCRLQFKVK